MAIIGISGKLNSGKDLVGDIIQWLVSDKIHSHKLDYYKWSHLNKNNDTNKYHLSTFKIVKFADKLKDIICILLGCTREQLENREFKETPLGEEWWYVKVANKIITVQEYFDYIISFPTYSFKQSDIIKLTPRLLLQLLGTECGRKIIHPNIWVNATMADYIPETIDWNPNSDIIVDLSDGDKGSMQYPNWIITDTRFPNESESITNKGGFNIRIDRPLGLRLPELWETYRSKLWEQYHNESNSRFIIEQNEEYFYEWLKIYDLESYKKYTHESETGLDDYQFKYVVHNNGTIEHLINQIREILLTEKII